MNIGIIQIDGTIPNLALMKLSAYHKKKGDDVFIMNSKVISQRLIPFDKVYISCVFDENKETALKIQKQFPDAEIGGVGVNNNKLIDHIEHLMPDYDGFNCDYSMGFTTRGCIRQCQFCVVSKHEGLIHYNTDIYEFWDKRHKNIRLLDNNILAMPKHFELICSQILKEGLTVDFNAGLDIRLLTLKSAKILKKLCMRTHYRFAFDNMADEPYIRKGVKILKKAGINQSMFYVLVGFNTTLEQDLYRCNLLKKLGQRPYIMRYNKCKHDRKLYSDLASWVNQTQFFMTVDFDTWRTMRKFNTVDLNDPRIKPKDSALQKQIQQVI